MISPAAHSSRAFSTTELIGVLAILSILMSIMVPSVFRRIEDAYVEKERQDLATIAKALEKQIQRTRSIPGDDWVSLVAEELAQPLARLTTSTTGSPRLMLLHPELQIGNSTGNSYTQSRNGSPIRPENLRIMLVSAHRRHLPSSIAGDSVTTLRFDELWNLPAGLVPESWPVEWNDHGDRLFVARLDLSPHICRLVVTSLSSDQPATIAIDDQEPFSILQSDWSSYYFKGTVVGLYNKGTLESSDVLTEDRSYVFERGVWRGSIRQGRSGGSDFVEAIESFRNASLNQLSAGGVNQGTVVSAYHHFALSYAMWTQAGFPGAGSPEYLVLTQSRDRFNLATSSLITQ